VLNALFSVIPLVLLVAGVWFLLRRRARRTERNGRFARMVDAYDRGETDRDSQEK
jgi:preprotein translocase subunit YajC